MKSPLSIVAPSGRKYVHPAPRTAVEFESALQDAYDKEEAILLGTLPAYRQKQVSDFDIRTNIELQELRRTEWSDQAIREYLTYRKQKRNLLFVPEATILREAKQDAERAAASRSHASEAVIDFRHLLEQGDLQAARDLASQRRMDNKEYYLKAARTVPVPLSAHVAQSNIDTELFFDALTEALPTHLIGPRKGLLGYQVGMLRAIPDTLSTFLYEPQMLLSKDTTSTQKAKAAANLTANFIPYGKAVAPAKTALTRLAKMPKLGPAKYLSNAADVFLKVFDGVSNAKREFVRDLVPSGLSAQEIAVNRAVAEAVARDLGLTQTADVIDTIAGLLNDGARVPTTRKMSEPIKSKELPDPSKIAQWEPDDYRVYGEMHGVPNLGPLSDLIEVSDGNGGVISLPGGLEGTFTFLDQLWLNGQRISPLGLSEEVLQRLYAKLARSIDPRPGDSLESLSRLMFAALSPNQWLQTNELLYLRLMPKTVEEVKRLSDFIDWQVGEVVSRKRRRDASRQMAQHFGFQARSSGGKGLAGTADLTSIAELAQAWLKDPDWFIKAADESEVAYVNRLASQIHGVDTKVASFGTGLQNPSASNIAAIDRHHLRRNFHKMFRNPRERYLARKAVVSSFNKYLTKYEKALLKRQGVGSMETLDRSLLTPRETALLALIEGGGAKTVREVLSSPCGDRVLYRVLAPALSGKRYAMTKEGRSLLAKSGFNPDAKAHLISPTYQRILKINAEAAAKEGMSLFTYMWREWDLARGVIEPHSSLFPGLRMLPRLDDSRFGDVVQQYRNNGYLSNRKAKDRLAPNSIAYWDRRGEGSGAFVPESNLLLYTDPESAIEELGHFLHSISDDKSLVKHFGPFEASNREGAEDFARAFSTVFAELSGVKTEQKTMPQHVKKSLAAVFDARSRGDLARVRKILRDGRQRIRNDSSMTERQRETLLQALNLLESRVIPMAALTFGRASTPRSGRSQDGGGSLAGPREHQTRNSGMSVPLDGGERRIRLSPDEMRLFLMAR